MALMFIAVLAGIGVDLMLDLRKRRAFRHRIERRLATIYGKHLVRSLVVGPIGAPLARRITYTNEAARA